MKAIYFVMCLIYLSAEAVVNQPTQEAQRREADIQPQPIPHQTAINQKRMVAMQRIIAAMRKAGYAGQGQAQGQGRVVNRPRRIPVSPPPNSYGPPQNSYGPPQQPSSSHGSLASFMHNHNPDVKCDGWIPIPGPSVGTGGGSAGHSASIDSSYGPPRHGSGNSGSHAQISQVQHIPLPPIDSYGPPSHGGGSAGHAQSIDSYGPPNHPPPPPTDSYGPPSHGGGSSGHAQQSIDSYGPPNHVPSPPIDSYGPPSHGGGSAGQAQHIQPPTDSYGPPNHPPPPPTDSYGPPSHGGGSSGHAQQSIDSYGPPNHVPSPPIDSYGPPSHGGGSAGQSQHLQPPTDSYGPPNHPPSPPTDSYGPPSHGGGSSGHSQSIDSYGPPNHVPSPPVDSYGPPSHGGGSAGHAQHIQPPVDSYGPPAPVFTQTHESHSSGHSSHSSVDSSYHAPQPVGHAVYGPPEVQPKHPEQHQAYGVPTPPQNFGPPESSYGPPPSGNVHSEGHEDLHHSSQGQGHAAEIQTIHSVGQDLQLPHIDSGAQFDNAIGLVTSSLGVSAGHNEVIQSHAIHESHTSELTNNFNGGDSYSAPPLDSYAPGKYAPSFMRPRPQQHQQQQHQPQQHQPPPPPINTYLPQRPPQQRPQPQPRPQYIPPVPMKLNRPQGPPPNFRPQSNGHAQSIAQGYSSGQSHSQSLHAPAPVRQPPRYPLAYRPPVPQGLFQSIGQQVQALDDAHRAQQSSNTYLPPPASELPIPPMKLIVPYSAPPQPFLSQHQHQPHSSGQSHAASSSSAYSFQNQELRNVHVIHDCGKGPQLSQNYGTPIGQPLETYNPPSQSYGSPSESLGLSNNYEIPAGALHVPQHNSIDFSSQSNSYGPPASGPASLDVIGLESQHRANTIVAAEQQNIVAAGSEIQSETLPGLSTGLLGSGLNFISAQKSHAITVPSNGGQGGSYQLQFTTSNSDHSSNRIDTPDHQQILADGLLQSILSAIEKKPTQTVPQITDEAETDHSEVQVFLKSPTGQEVLADKPAARKDEVSS